MFAFVAVMAVIGAVAGVSGLVLGLRARRVQRPHAGGVGPRRVPAPRQRYEGASLSAEVGRLSAELAALRSDAGRALQHVALVRYDAFPDMSGRQSFSAALLDSDGDGLVITTITGRSESRTYAKGVRAGAGAHPLSSEEEHAVDGAHKRRLARHAPASAPTRRPARTPAVR